MSIKSNPKKQETAIPAKKDMEKLVITATTANSWIHPDIKNWATTTDMLVDSAVKCCEAGASILHIHLPKGEESSVVKRVREHCDAIIQCGMSSFPIEQRDAHFVSGSDMLSIILNHHDEHFAHGNVNQLHPLDELEQYCVKCKKFNIRPEWEVWHAGSYWNLNWLIKKDLLSWSKPHVLTMFFNWPGGTWSPPTVDEYFQRVKYMPPECAHTVSIMGNCKEQTPIVAAAINNGGNVRVGTEDNPFIREGVPAKDNAEIIARLVRLSKELGRDVADPSEARKILNIKKAY
nr:3-keto-5-aminohexanoate cleavage protein [Candidatus Sigynarchaeota archaeon]